jgi:hypothetical protein
VKITDCDIHINLTDSDWFLHIVETSQRNRGYIPGTDKRSFYSPVRPNSAFYAASLLDLVLRFECTELHSPRSLLAWSVMKNTVHFIFLRSRTSHKWGLPSCYYILQEINVRRWVSFGSTAFRLWSVESVNWLKSRNIETHTRTARRSFFLEGEKGEKRSSIHSADRKQRFCLMSLYQLVILHRFSSNICIDLKS